MRHARMYYLFLLTVPFSLTATSQKGFESEDRYTDDLSSRGYVFTNSGFSINKPGSNPVVSGVQKYVRSNKGQLHNGRWNALFPESIDGYDVGAFPKKSIEEGEKISIFDIPGLRNAVDQVVGGTTGAINKITDTVNFFRGAAATPGNHDRVLEDYRTAFETIPGDAKLVLIGHSMGGTAVIRAATEVAAELGRNVDILVGLDPVDSSGFKAGITKTGTLVKSGDKQFISPSPLLAPSVVGGAAWQYFLRDISNANYRTITNNVGLFLNTYQEGDFPSIENRLEYVVVSWLSGWYRVTDWTFFVPTGFELKPIYFPTFGGQRQEVSTELSLDHGDFDAVTPEYQGFIVANIDALNSWPRIHRIEQFGQQVPIILDTEPGDANRFVHFLEAVPAVRAQFRVYVADDDEQSGVYPAESPFRIVIDPTENALLFEHVVGDPIISEPVWTAEATSSGGILHLARFLVELDIAPHVNPKLLFYELPVTLRVEDNGWPCGNCAELEDSADISIARIECADLGPTPGDVFTRAGEIQFTATGYITDTVKIPVNQTATTAEVLANCGKADSVDARDVTVTISKGPAGLIVSPSTISTVGREGANIRFVLPDVSGGVTSWSVAITKGGEFVKVEAARGTALSVSDGWSSALPATEGKWFTSKLQLNVVDNVLPKVDRGPRKYYLLNPDLTQPSPSPAIAPFPLYANDTLNDLTAGFDIEVNWDDGSPIESVFKDNDPLVPVVVEHDYTQVLMPGEAAEFRMDYNAVDQWGGRSLDGRFDVTVYDEALPRPNLPGQTGNTLAQALVVPEILVLDPYGHSGVLEVHDVAWPYPSFWRIDANSPHRNSGWVTDTVDGIFVRSGSEEPVDAFVGFNQNIVNPATITYEIEPNLSGADRETTLVIQGNFIDLLNPSAPSGPSIPIVQAGGPVELMLSHETATINADGGFFELGISNGGTGPLIWNALDPGELPVPLKQVEFPFLLGIGEVGNDTAEGEGDATLPIYYSANTTTSTRTVSIAVGHIPVRNTFSGLLYFTLVQEPVQPDLRVLHDDESQALALEVEQNAVGMQMLYVVDDGAGNNRFTATVTQGDEWLAVATTGKAGKEALAVETLSVNDSLDDRTGIVELRTESTSDIVEIPVTQLGLVAEFEVTPSTPILSHESGQIVLDVNNVGLTNLRWNASPGPGTTWFTTDRPEEFVDGNGTIVVTYEANDTGQDRSGVLAVLSQGADDQKIIEIRQAMGMAGEGEGEGEGETPFGCAASTGSPLSNQGDIALLLIATVMLAAKRRRPQESRS